MRNTVTYNISKTKVVLFSKARKQKMVDKVTTIKLKFGGQVVKFNQEAT